MEINKIPVVIGSTVSVETKNGTKTGIVKGVKNNKYVKVLIAKLGPARNYHRTKITL